MDYDFAKFPETKLMKSAAILTVVLMGGERTHVTAAATFAKDFPANGIMI